MYRYKVVAVGGTFDYIHKGHRVLLMKAFEIGEKVLIGVTSDRFVRLLGKSPEKTLIKRIKVLKHFIAEVFPERQFVIQPLDDYFGRLFFDDDVEAIVVSDETLSRVELANRLRAERRLKPVKAVIVERILADDGEPISTTRIRRGEIDTEGHIVG